MKYCNLKYAVAINHFQTCLDHVLIQIVLLIPDIPGVLFQAFIVNLKRYNISEKYKVVI